MTAQMFSSLRIRNYRLFASGQIVSVTGTWMQRIAQDWLVLELTGNSGTALGVATGLQFLPVLLFGLYGGVIADRYPKRRILRCTQAFMGTLALALGVLDLTGVVSLWQVYALAFGLGLGTAVDNPTRQAFVIEMVGPDDIPNAVSLNSATFNSGRILGPAIGGLLIHAIDTGPVFVVNAASYIAVIFALTLMRESELFAVERVPRARGQLREGLRYVRRRPELLMTIILVGIIGMFGFNMQVTQALMAKNVFDKGAGAYGLLGTAYAVGSLGGALLAARRGRPRQRTLLGAAIGFGLFEVFAGLMPTYLSFALLLVPTGMLALTLTTAANSTMQLGSSPLMRGRVMALYLLVFLGGTPIGSPIIGAVAEAFGARWSLIGGGLISASAGVVIAALLARRAQLRIEPRLRGGRPHVRVRSRVSRRSTQPVLDEPRPVR